MREKLKLILVTIISVVLLIGCQQTQDNKTKLVYEELSQKEECLLNVTGNKVLRYNIKNFPKDKNYEITLMYEVYKNTEKVKDQIITSIFSDDTCEKIDNENIIINFQDDKIRYNLADNNSRSYSSGSLNIEEKINGTQSYLTKDIDLALGTEVYIYQRSTSTSTSNSISLGTTVTIDELNNILKNNEENIFIKLIYKEV